LTVKLQLFVVLCPWASVATIFTVCVVAASDVVGVKERRSVDVL
jgi:hypothetical protein